MWVQTPVSSSRAGVIPDVKSGRGSFLALTSQSGKLRECRGTPAEAFRRHSMLSVAPEWTEVSVGLRW